MPPYQMHAMLSSSVHWYQVSLPEIWHIIRIESGKKKYWGKKKITTVHQWLLDHDFDCQRRKEFLSLSQMLHCISILDYHSIFFLFNKDEM